MMVLKGHHSLLHLNSTILSCFKLLLFFSVIVVHEYAYYSHGFVFLILHNSAGVIKSEIIK